MRSINTSFFVQDDFKLSKRLTVNMGLRYELLGPFDETRGVERSTVKIPQNATFRLGIQSTVIPSAPPDPPYRRQDPGLPGWITQHDGQGRSQTDSAASRPGLRFDR